VRLESVRIRLEDIKTNRGHWTRSSTWAVALAKSHQKLQIVVLTKEKNLFKRALHVEKNSEILLIEEKITS